jgi:hypothetical protein
VPSKPRSLKYAEQAALQSLGLFYDPSKIKSIKNRSNTAFNPEECEAKMMSGLLPTQKDFVGDFENRYVLYVGGLGCMAAESLVEVWDGAKYVKTPIADLCSAPFFVKTLAGPALAFPAYRKGYATLYRVELEDGRKFLATKDHRCLSPLGWVQVKHLVAGSVIAADGKSSDQSLKEKSTDWLPFDPQGSRSCGESQSPLEVFVQEQSERPVVPSISPDPSVSLSHRSSLCTDDYTRLAALRLSLLNFELAEMILASSPERQNVEQVHAFQSLFLGTLELRVQQHTQALQDRFCHETLAASRRRQAVSSQFHISGLNRFGNSLLGEGREPRFELQRLACPRKKPEIWEQDFSVSCLWLPGNSQCQKRFDFRSCLAFETERSGLELSAELGRACNDGNGLPQSTWSRVKTVESVREDFYYDFHVPALNHYIADGVVHHNSGKSYASVIKSILLAFRSPGKQHIYLEPTYGMINTVALPTWFKVLDAYNIPYTYRAAPPPKIYLHLPGGKTEIIMLPLLNYERLVGINAASAVVDEADTVKQEIAEAALVKLQGRVRVGGCPQICFASTPEGRKFIWSFFEKEKSDDKALYRADTRQNPHIDENYVLDLMQKYPPHLVEAYVKGEFVNLETATVFSEYDRIEHRSTVFHAENGEVILIGADFNIGKCSSVYAVMRRSPAGQILHVFDEHIARDTFSLAEHIKKKYAAHLMRNMIIIYPDSSGSHGSTSSTMSDHDILRECGAKVIADRRNPPIAETVAHANNCFHKNQLYINDSTCNDLVEVCENWSYDATLKPAKGGRIDYSHFGDALRYLVWQSIERPGVGLGRGQRWR